MLNKYFLYNIVQYNKKFIKFQNKLKNPVKFIKMLNVDQIFKKLHSIIKLRNAQCLLEEKKIVFLFYVKRCATPLKIGARLKINGQIKETR